jgi:hypothetical protein
VSKPIKTTRSQDQPQPQEAISTTQAEPERAAVTPEVDEPEIDVTTWGIIKSWFRWLRWGRWVRVVGGVAAVYLAVVIITGLAIYIFGWRGAWADAVSEVAYYPVISVNGQTADYHRYYVLDRAERVSATGSSFTSAELNTQALASLKQQLVIAAWAKSHNITVSGSEASAAVSAQLAAMGTTKAALATIHKQYGYNRAEYTSWTAGQLLQAKVVTALAIDPSYQNQLRTEAQAILKQAEAGTDFNTLASQYSQDVTGVLAGDQALIPSTSLPTAVAKVATGLQDGQVYTGVVEASGNWYLVKRVQTTSGVVMVRIIELKPSLGDWLTGQLATAHVRQLMPVNHAR